jgi:hypothetical protein
MGIRYKFKQAEKIISVMAPHDRTALERICREIEAAEKRLLEAAREMMTRCYTACEGICCRNIHLDEILSLWDAIYLLALAPSVRETIAKCLEADEPLFSADCIFLQHGVGPCIFPFTIRPEVCITSFCTDDAPVKKEILLVKRKFLKLCLFTRLRRPRALKRAFLRTFQP